MKAVQYDSKSLGTRRQSRVYAPPGYSANNKYPVLDSHIPQGYQGRSPWLVSFAERIFRRRGEMTMTANFRQSGKELTGTIDGPGGEPMKIQDGTVDGDKIVFTVALNGMKIVHEGIIRGDEMTLKIMMDNGPGDGPGPITLKRVK